MDLARAGFGADEHFPRPSYTRLRTLARLLTLAQMAMTIAAGLHPFVGVPISDHDQVLVIDAENSERQTGRRYRMTRAPASRRFANSTASMHPTGRRCCASSSDPRALLSTIH
jgi:hypothetical protein